MRQPRYADPERYLVVQFLFIADVVVELFVDIKFLVIDFFVFFVIDGIVVEQFVVIHRVLV
ncbi:MAG: hypothetical protein H0W18_00135 [Acidobacteria bacterium]|nr:hypothetical protein [Acidobacteriota bacterium]